MKREDELRSSEGGIVLDYSLLPLVSYKLVGSGS